MKALLALIYLVLAATEYTGVEVPVLLPDETQQAELVRLQLDEIKLQARYRDGHPQMISTRQKIAALLAQPDIRNDIYYTIMTESLASLRLERAQLVTRFRLGSPVVVLIDQQIAFAEKTISDRVAAPAASK